MSLLPFAIGVSGHQNLGDAATRDFVAQNFRELLRVYQQRASHLVLYSCLAPGADQLFVQIALEQGVPVEVILPCSEYETIFHTDEDRRASARKRGNGGYGGVLAVDGTAFHPPSYGAA